MGRALADEVCMRGVILRGVHGVDAGVAVAGEEHDGGGTWWPAVTCW